ncbi:DUF3880 domain-containing protein [Peribacillus frigoritolerans]|uniref:DUF3880 domain-containing protein n=1 Tax=Peribacillus frigoritolerans TaxID=450367 RepID=A0AAJ1QNQ7_9BACI|nr:DUF3880 domain-containing protein [Peribacillus frigoritolerans]MDM5284693.1 DUF3880 domain-containing protein [Peribacillus frigoritolerans]
MLVLLGNHFPVEKVQSIRNAGIKTAVWLTDCPYYFDKTIQYTIEYDFVLTNDYQKFGCKQVYYMPLAVNTGVFRPQPVNLSYLSGICIVATAFHE